MTLEELKAEAKKQGYNLVKAYERKVPLLPCPICGGKPVRREKLIPCKCIMHTLECTHDFKPFHIGDKLVVASASVHLYDIFRSGKEKPKAIEVTYHNPYVNPILADKMHKVNTFDKGLTKVELDKMLREAWNENVEWIKSKMEELKNGTDVDV